MGARDTEWGERKSPHSETTLPQTSGSLSIGKTSIFGICKSERRVRIGYCNEKTRRTTTNRSLRLMLALRSAGACQNLFLEQRERPTDSCTLCCKRSRLRHRCRGAWTIHLGEQSLMSSCNACRWVSLRLDLLQLLQCSPPTNVAPKLVCANRVKEDMKRQVPLKSEQKLNFIIEWKCKSGARK